MLEINRIKSRKAIFTLVLVLFAINLSSGLKEDECEVCRATIDKFVGSLDETVKKDPKKIEESFKKFCKGSKNKENRFVSCNKRTFLKEFG